MKNSFLSALLALGIGLTPGFGLNFMSGNSTEWAHTDAAENSAKTVETTAPETKSPVATAQPAPAIAKSRVASASSYPAQSAR